jgi:Ser/Thr protein kinase RdoA (MazF antagonist)
MGNIRSSLGENKMEIVRSTIAEAEILQKLKDNYSCCTPGSLCMFEYRGVNDIYRLNTGKDTFFLKFYARKDIDRNAIQAEVEIVNHLKRSGLSVAYPIPMMNDQYLLSIETPEGTRFGVLFSKAEGIPCNNNLLDEQETAEIGRLISNTHILLDAIPNHLDRWKLDDQTFLDRSIEILESYHNFHPHFDLLFLKDVVRELKHQIEANCAGWNWGLCHGDYFTGNIYRKENGELTLFDFDFCGYGWRAYDVSPFVGNFSSGVGEEAIANRKKRLDSFVKGYQHSGGLSDGEIEAIYKVFVPFRRIFNLGYLYEVLHYVWGNKIRHDQITHDTRLLQEWVDYYW